MKNKYIVGADPFPPYQYYNAEGVLKGSDYEMVDKVIKKMGATSEYLLEDWDVIEKKLINKEIDIAFQVQKTPEREKKYYFSKLLRNAITTIVSINSEDLESVDHIEGLNKKLAVIKGYKYGDTIDLLPDNIKVFCDSQLHQLEMMIDNKADFAVVDLGVFEYQLNGLGFKEFKVLRQLDFKRPLYVVFGDPLIRNEFNKKM